MVTMNKLKLFSFISFLCICTATADAVAVTNSVDAASLSVPAADAESSFVSSDTNSDAAGSLSEENKNAASDNVDAAESAEANQKEEEEHHELTEAFEIMDEDEDGVLSKEELVNAAYITGVNGDISLEEYAEKLMTKQVADADGSVEMKIDMDTFTAMLSLASTEVAAEEGQAPSMNQQWSQLASEVIISYYHPQEEHSESAEATQEEEHHELTEAFEIMDEDEDGVLSKEELVKAAWITGVNGDISLEEYAEKLMTKQVADADGSVEMKIDMDTFSAMLSLASTEVAAEEGQAPSMNQQWSQLASEVIISYYHPQEEPEWYNPHNMTYEELEYHLYEWEEDAVGHVNEYLDWEVFERMRNEADDYYKNEGAEEQVKEEDEKKNPKHHDNGKKTVVEMRKSNTNHYLKLSPDVAHVVEFYQPWCPHCQHYKSDYIEVAKETKRRATTTQVEFHAISCEVYWRICSTYGVDGFPTVIGWKKGESLEKAGIVMNDDEDIYPDLVGEMLDLDLANEAVQVYTWEFETEKERRDYEKKQAEKAKKAARKKLSWHEHSPNTHNDRYHNAALSFAFATKTQLFQTLTEDGKMEPKRKNALVDFLNLLEWATPPSWNLRTGLVKELQWNLHSDAIKSREVVENVIDSDVHRHRSGKQDLLWGYVDPKKGTSWTGGLLGPSDEQLAKDDKKWTKTCTHSEPAKGFTCGLWNLFHILTIGSTKPEQGIYGFHRGYFVSPHHVAETIRNFIAYFFSCDVCRTHFLDMYDNCGHDHCTRLKSEINTGTKGGSEREVAMWLWEVHNDVNARLMKEAAQRQNRNVTQEETLASRFPTKKMCPDCWLDDNMTKWDNATVFKFLDEWYWPSDLPPSSQFKSVISGKSDNEADLDVTDTSSSKTRSWKMNFISTSFLIAFISLVAVAVTRKRREKRKKFVDSRFVAKKKKGCFE